MSTQTFAGKYVLVSGINQGREVFLGKVIDEPYGGKLSVEGKPIGVSPQGTITARPFATLAQFPVQDPSYQIQQIGSSDVKAEAERILSTSLVYVDRRAFPLISRWIEPSVRREIPFQLPPSRVNGVYSSNPLVSLQAGFMTSAEQFHKALFRAPRVTSTIELDRLSELQGNLLIEVGKVTNQMAVRFNQLIAQERDLVRYFEIVERPTTSAAPTLGPSGWAFLFTRFETAKNWARRAGKTAFVREINQLSKEGISRVTEIILDHCGSLDTMIAEACASHGITPEEYGETSPLSHYALAGPSPEAMESPTFSVAAIGSY
jgi:hypothetical protein